MKPSKIINAGLTFLCFLYLNTIPPFLQSSSAQFELQKNKSNQVSRDLYNKETSLIETGRTLSKDAPRSTGGSDLLGRGLGQGASPFKTGFDPETPPSWSDWIHPDVKYNQPPVSIRPGQYDRGLRSRQISKEILQASDSYNIPPDSTPDQISRTLDKINGNLDLVVHEADQKADLYPKTIVKQFMDEADAMSAATNNFYGAMDDMFKDVDSMYAALDQNYQVLNGYETISGELATQFNAASDAMADHVFGMVDAVGVMIKETNADLDQLTSVIGILDNIEGGGQGTSANYDQVVKQINSIANGLDRSLRNINGSLDLQKNKAEEIKNYITGVTEYFNQLKGYSADQISDAGEIRKYLEKIKAYLENVLKSLLQAKSDLEKAEQYFRSAKVDLDTIETGAGGSDVDICAAADPKGMSPLRDCAKSCRTVCRWKSKVADTDCYECPTPSAESCFDIGAWPQNHPWCQPGGVCYDDPMFYCAPFGAVSPNGTPLQCTNCKQRPDLCWQQVGRGTTLTNCTLGCWNGTCKYIGRYDQPEWDGRAEWIHCYECVTPPPPPTCEDLGWGYDFEEDCKNNCPDPGVCQKEKKKTGDKGKKGGDNGDDDQGDNGDDGDGTDTGDDDGGDTGGGTAQPPSGTPEQPSGMPGEIAGGEAEQPAEGEDEPEPPTAPGNRPQGSAPNQPTAPSTDQPEAGDTNKPIPPQPPEPITNQNIQWLETRLADVEERIKKFEGIINDPATGETLSRSAQEALDDAKRERENILRQLEEEKQKQLQRQQEAAEQEERRKANDERTAERFRQWEAEDQAIQDKIRKQELEEFRQANQNLETRAREMQEALNARRARIQDYDRRIEALEHQLENESTRTREAEDELAQLRSIRNELAKSYKETERAYQQELEELKTEYRTQLFDIDEGARRRAEVERIDQYYERNEELRQLEKTRKVSDATFETITRDMEQKIEDAVKAGDENKAEQLTEELENIKRGKGEWDAVYDTRERRLKDELHQMGWQNFTEGAGPSDSDVLVRQLGEYAELFDKQIKQTESVLAKLQAEGTVEREVVDQVNAQLAQLRETRDGIQAKKDSLMTDYQLTQEDIDGIIHSASNIAEGSRTRGEEASFASLFAESLGEEFVHNLNPLVMMKKNVAFAWGVAQGVGSAVKGLVELGIAVDDLMFESYAQALGFEDGGIFGTDSTDKLYSMLSTGSDYASFDGIVKAAVAAGGIIDGELKRLEKSGDIDWATAELGGKVAGEVVVGDAVIEAGLGRLGSALAKTDELVDAGRAAERAGEAGKTGSHLDANVPTHTPDVEGVPGTSAADDVRAPHGPDGTPSSSRGPPRSAGTLDNTKPLPTNGRPVTRLDDAEAAALEAEHGFKQEHAQRMSEFAQETDTYLIVRDGNVDSVQYFDDVDKVPKPMSSKAKTAKVGPDIGLVVDPTHPTQARYWAEELTRAAQEGIDNGGDFSRLRELEKARQKALDSWADYGDYMLEHGYVVDDKTGRVLMETTGPDGEKVYKAVHGDYDLHGAYKRNPDGTVDRASFGDGNSTADGEVLRRQLNDAITGGEKDFIQHGAQDDWIPDPEMVPNKPPDPPVTVFLPDGGTVHLKNAEEMKNFYENTMGIKWDYPAPKSSTPAAKVAADAVPSASTPPSSATSTPKTGDMGARGGSVQDIVPTVPDRALGVTSADDVVGKLGSGLDDVTAAPPSGRPAPLTANGNAKFTTPDGQEIPIRTGDQIGQGYTSSVYRNADNPNQVIRVTDLGGEAPQAPILDKAGREIIESVQSKLGDNSPIRIVEQYQRYEVSDVNSPLFNKSVEVTELAPQGSAKKVLAEQGTNGVMTDGQARAFDQATRALNDQGYAWLDNHSGNYTFEPMPGGGPDDWRLVVIDPGGVVPMKGANATEKAANARAIQSRLNNPDPEFQDLMKTVDKAPDSLKLSVLGEERQNILKAHGQNIDVEAMGLTDPQQVSFNPGGLLKQEKVQTLNTMSAQDAARFGK